MDNKKVLEKVMEKLNNKFKPSISEDEKLVTMADSSAAQVQWIPTNILALDRVMGGGLPRGRVVTIWGSSASGKSTTALQIISAVQKQGGNAAFIDAEQTYYPEWAEACGVDNSSLLLIRPDYGEQALDMVQELVKTNEFDVIVIDSVPALTPKAIVDKAVEERTMAETARMMTTFLSKVTPIIAKTKTSLILLNQVRSNVGVMYGPTEVMPGGKAIGFYSSIVLKVSKDKKQIVLDKLTGDAIGHMMIVKNEKNKVASPFRSSSYMFYYNQGADNREAVIDDAIFKGIIIKPASGPTYRINFNGQEVKIVGRGNICKYLMENQDVANYVVEATQVPEYYKNVFSKDWSVDTETEISNEEVSL